MLDDIICSLSGITPGDDEIMVDLPPQSTWLPTGWIRVTVERKYPNPQWVKLQGVKQSLVEATLQQIPEEHREGQRENVEVQVDAQYHQLEVSEKYKATVIEKEIAYISPPEADDEILDEYMRLLDLLGLDIYEDEDEVEVEGEPEAEAESNEVVPAPEEEMKAKSAS